MRTGHPDEAATVLVTSGRGVGAATSDDKAEGPAPPPALSCSPAREASLRVGAQAGHDGPAFAGAIARDTADGCLLGFQDSNTPW